MVFVVRNGLQFLAGIYGEVNDEKSEEKP